MIIMHQPIFDFIKSKVAITDEALTEALTYVRFVHYPKGDHLLRIGQYCRYVAFLNKGLIMNTFLSQEGKEVICTFFLENEFFTYVESLNNNIPSHKNFIAVEDCQVAMIEKTDLPKIFAIHPGFETLFNNMILEGFQKMLLYEEVKRTQTAEERYRHIQTNYPQLLEKAPLKYIAGYLGVEPPSLSRLRKRLTKSSEINKG